MLKILQVRLQQYVNRELPDVQAGFRKGRRTRDQIANIQWIMEKAREFQKNICFCFIDYAKAFDCVDHNKLWKILQEMGIPDHLTCLLRNLYAGQEATVRTGHGTTVQFSSVAQSCLTLCNPVDYTVHGILQARILEWVAFPFLEIFPTQGSNPGLPHRRWILYRLSHKGSPWLRGSQHTMENS